MIEPNDSTLMVLNDLIHQQTGHFYDNGKLDRLKEKLLPLLQERGFDSFMDYYYLLRYGEDASQEWLRVQRALAVNETYFWREYDAIRVAAEILVPQIQKKHPERSIRIWHTACASGEEPYTMAITLREAGAFDRGDIEIVATDFNVEALERAEQAVYKQRSFRSIPSWVFSQYFTPMEDELYQLDKEICQRVSFEYLNLMDETRMKQMRNFDIIFCRNAFIYMSTTAIGSIAEWFYQSLTTPGYLFTAAAESLLRITTLFDLDEIGGSFVYIKR